MIGEELYKELRAENNDPVVLCYKLFNHYSRIRIDTYSEFIKLFGIWLQISTGAPLNVLSGALRIQKKFDEKFKIEK